MQMRCECPFALIIEEYIFHMDIERNSKNSKNSNQLNQDRSSFRSSIMSLQRFSDRRHSSLSHRVSLISAMDIEHSNKSNRAHDDLLIGVDEKLFSDLRRCSSKSKEPYSYTVDVEEKDLNRKSHYKITHECSCSERECNGTHCICFLTPRQICVIGQCCDGCIAAKNQYLQTTRGFQLPQHKKSKDLSEQEDSLLKMIKQKNCKNMHYMKQVYANEPCMRDLLFCTCKKSHCQKKYCLCFQKGIKCGQFCICIECENKENDEDQFREEEQRRWERYATYKPYDEEEDKAEMANIDPDIEQYLEEENKEVPFAETMEFQPVNFDSLLSHSP